MDFESQTQLVMHELTCYVTFYYKFYKNDKSYVLVILWAMFSNTMIDKLNKLSNKKEHKTFKNWIYKNYIIFKEEYQKNSAHIHSLQKTRNKN